MRRYFTILLLFFFYTTFSQVDLTLESLANGFTNPIGITHAGDDRLFITERPGRVKIIDGQGNTLGTPFLDIDNLVIATGGFSEQGLLGLAFHPEYATNGYMYVHYTANDGDSQISRFSVSSADPNLADANSELKMLKVSQPYGNHNGGDLKFGPDGYLYIGFGDGGWFDDPDNNSQDPQTLLGAMLRIDVDGAAPYSIPADNPFVNDANVLDEIWSLGLRNPWRFSFDKLTGDLWIGDVGQDQYAEIDFEPAGGPGGLNYGWRCYEGLDAYLTNGCGNVNDYTDPIFVYAHGVNSPCSITGGFVYRGSTYVDLYGKYIYADYCSGDIWALGPDGAGGWTNESLDRISGGAWTSFGEGADGELYICGLNNGTVYKVTTAATVQPPTISLNGDVLEIAEGDFTPYTAYQWFLDGQEIGGATNETFTPSIDGDYYVQVTTSIGSLENSNTLNVVLTNTEGLTIVNTGIIVFPNPFTNTVNVEVNMDSKKDVSFKIFGINGQEIRNWKATSTKQNFMEVIPVNDLSKGIYQLEVTIGEEVFREKLIKQ